MTLAAASTSALFGDHSALAPAGPQAGHIHTLWWIYLGVCTSVFVLVLAFTLIGAARPRSVTEPIDAPILSPSSGGERRMGITVISAVAATVVLLFVLLITDYVSGRAIHSLAAADEPVRMAITGHQWWWEVSYQGKLPSQTLVTANEIHIPVGRTVGIELASSDVIHSFWVPNLHGKRDLIPGHPTTIWLRADRAGTYEGQCAEFCGTQHAQMRLLVIAEPQEKFASWLAGQLKPSAEPTSDVEKHGRQVFLTSSCILCHTIRGTDANGRLGPDLTHLASRRLIAANSLPNTPGHLAGWIVDPQKIKPGVIMPQNALAPQDLRDLLKYLENLQ
jgi:cytochrome c oxidase subunit 2